MAAQTRPNDLAHLTRAAAKMSDFPFTFTFGFWPAWKARMRKLFRESVMY